MNKAIKSARLGEVFAARISQFEKRVYDLRMLMILPIALSLAACAGNQDQQAQNGPVDSGGNQNPAFAEGFEAMKKGDNVTARREFEISEAAAPNDPYEQLNLGAAYQNTGSMEKAVPLYRQLMVANHNIVPQQTTLSDDQGMILEAIAQRNCEKAGLDQNCNAMSRTTISQTTMSRTETAAVMLPPATLIEK